MQEEGERQLLCQTHNEPQNLVCLDQSCEKKGLLCPHCQYKDHRHQVKSLGLLLKQIDSDIKSYQNSIQLLSQLDAYFNRIVEQVEKIESQQQKNNVKEMAFTYYQFHVGRLYQRNTEAKRFRSLPMKSSQEVNTFLLAYNFVDKNANPQNYTNFQHEVHLKLEEFSNSLKQIVQSIKANQSLEKLMKIFEVDQNKKIKYFFNSQKSHRDIIITDKSKATLKEGYSYRIGLLDPPIKKQSGKLRKKTISFKITKVTAMVGIGLIYRKKAETANYLFSAYSQHGCYLITNSGYTYNESNSTFNSQLKNWNYTTNDIIKVTIEPKQKKVMFQKQGKDVFEMPFEEKNQMELNFGVLLCQQNQCVEIV